MPRTRPLSLGMKGNELYLELSRHGVGRAARDDRTQFEFLILEGAQAGLCWSTILSKREGYREAFAGFDPERIARFGKRDVARLMNDPGIVRNRLKIESAISNARAFLEFQASTAASPSTCGASSAASRSRTTSREHEQVPATSARVRRAQQGSEAARLPLRRHHDHLRAHAGDRHGERSPHQLLPLQGVRGAREKEVTLTSSAFTRRTSHSHARLRPPVGAAAGAASASAASISASNCHGGFAMISPSRSSRAASPRAAPSARAAGACAGPSSAAPRAGAAPRVPP